MNLQNYDSRWDQMVRHLIHLRDVQSSSLTDKENFVLNEPTWLKLDYLNTNVFLEQKFIKKNVYNY